MPYTAMFIIAICVMVAFIVSGAFAIGKGTHKTILLGAMLQVLGIMTSFAVFFLGLCTFIRGSHE